MKNRRQNNAVAKAKLDRSKQIRVWLGSTAILMGGALWAGQVFADGHESTTVSHGYSYFGDLKYGPDFKHLDYVNPDAPKGGEISVWTQGTFDSFNPFTRNGRAGALAGEEFQSILTTTADDPTASYCFLCETMEYPESRDWVIFNLRDNITYSNGAQATAGDIKFFFDTIMEQGLPSFRAAFGSQIEAVEVIDDLTIKFTFTEEAPRRDVIELAGIFRPFHQEYWEANDIRLDESTLDLGPGTGPYIRDSWDFNKQIVYTYNPDYWAADLPLSVGRNNFESIRVEYFTDASAAFEAFKVGEYTFRIENTSKQWATGYNFEAIDEGWVNVAELNDGSPSSGQSYVFNLRKEKFQDPLVREALGYMFNFEWSNEVLFYGLYERVNSFWENTPLRAEGIPSAEEIAILQPLVDDGLLDPALLTDEAVVAPVSGTRPLDRGNLRLASALLDEAGWLTGDDGMRRKNGQVLEVEILSANPGFDRIHNPVVENMTRLGVQASLNRIDPSQYTERLRAYDFDLANHGFVLGLEPSTGLKQYFGSEAKEESSRNLMGYSSDAVDALIEIVIAAETKEDLNVAISALDRVLRAERFWIPQWFNNRHNVAYYDMFEYPDPLPAYALGNLDFWWFNAEKAEALKAAGAFR